MRTVPRQVAIPCISVLLALVSGCGATGPSIAAASPSLAGNWSVATAAAPASNVQVQSVGGALLVSPTGKVTGTLHAVPAVGQSAASLCVSPSAPIPVAGQYTSDNHLVLTSSAVNGSTVVVSGTYAAGTNQLQDATFTIKGTCGVAAQPAVAVRMAAINGTYTGSFVSDQGPSIPVSATLTQTSQPDTNGVYHLTGSATFPTDSCVTAPVVTDSTVAGSAFSATYTDATSHATIVATGTFDPNAGTLTIANYTLSGTGGCADTGHGALSRPSL